MKQLKHLGPNTVARTKDAPGFVREKAPGPQAKQADYKIAKGPAPDRGQTSRNMQTGSTSPSTDGGGGMGNSSEALHRKIFGK